MTTMTSADDLLTISHNHLLKIGDKASIKPLTWGDDGGRYWDRTSDLFGVNEALSR
jgi:hypothetical protein